MMKIIGKLLIVNSLLIIAMIVSAHPILAQNPLGTISSGNLPVPSIGLGGSNTFVAGLIRNIILLMILASFIAALIYTILAGIKFITAGGDPKEVSAAQSQITWGIIGLVVVIAAYAVIRVVEIFFNIDLITGGLTLPGLSTP